MKNILIPTDFSENSWNALKYALLLFGSSECNFYLLHVVEPYVYPAGDMPRTSFREEFDGLARSRAREKLRDIVLRVEDEMPGCRPDFILLSEYDYFIDAIRKQAEEKKADLIVMGTKGASGIKEMMVGSNTGDVITKVKCPVLAVPEHVIFRTPEQIAFPTDFSIPYSAKVLNTMFSMADRYSSVIRVLHVVKNAGESLTEEQKANKELLKDYLNNREYSFHTLTTEKNLGEAIQNFTGIMEVDWIAMMAKKLNFFQQTLFKPTVARISYHTRVPFLVLHE